MQRIGEASSRFKARIAGGFYLLTFVMGSLAAVLGGGLAVLGHIAGLIATACYIAVTLLFYDLFRVVSRRISLLAALFGLMGCAFGALSPFHLAPFKVNSLVFFGFYCLLIGYLVLRSTFLPRILGVLMAFGGLGWLTFAFPTFANQLSPFNVAPALLGEGSLTLWLLVIGLNQARWEKQASVSRATTLAHEVLA